MVTARVIARAGVIAVSFAVTVATGESQQPSGEQSVRPPAGTARVMGTVVDSAAPPRPVRRARVSLRIENTSRGWEVASDDNGRFVMANVGAGRYMLRADKPAWVTGRYGAARPGRPGVPIVIADGATVQGLTIAMSRGAAISGTVMSRSGEPVPDAMISAVGARERHAGTDVTADDEGHFRLYGLPAGEYRVLASLRNGPATALMDLVPQTEAQISGALKGTIMPRGTNVGFASLFAPGVVTRDQAQTIRVAAEEERDGITIRLDPVPTARITVTIDPGESADPASIRLSLIPDDSEGSLLTGRRGGDGRYEFSGVPPVPHVAVARAARLGGAATAAGAAAAGRGRGAGAPLTLYAIENLAVTGGEINVTLRLQPGVPVSGRVAVENGPAAAPPISGVPLGLVAMSGAPGLGVPSVRSGADGTFSFEGVPPGRYRLERSTIAGVELKSAMWRGVDVLDAGLDVRPGESVTDLVVTLVSRPTELTGRLETAAGAAAPDYYIVAFAADRQFWAPQSRRIRQTRPASDGNFSIRGLPAGDYLLAALTDVERDEWFDPAFLAQLVPAAVRVTLSDGAATTQNLRIR
jgi:hypothetical protein